MFVGHLAVAFGARKVEPRIPLGAAVAAGFGLDLLWPIFLLLGIETVSIHPGDTAFTGLSFDSYPWSHSLLMAIVWSTIAALLARAVLGSWRVGLILGGLVLSHWILDFVTHRPDMPLWPSGPMTGLGLWNSVPGTILVEGGLLVAGLALYSRAHAARDGTGRWALAGLVALTSVMWITQPWSPPPPSAAAVAWASLIMWLLPLWAFWIDRHRA